MGSDLTKIENEINTRNSIVADIVVKMCQRAQGALSRKCSSVTREFSAHI